MTLPTNPTTRYLLATVVVLVAIALLIWLSLGVGIIGADGDPANLLYTAVLVVTLVGAGVARFRPQGMAWTLLAAAGTQALITLVALATGLGLPASPPAELISLNAIFIALFAASAWLYKLAGVRR